jgi:hypothetical protein
MMRAKRLPNAVVGLVVLLLFWALLPINPYTYYISLRWVCCPTLAYLCWAAFAQGRTDWALGLGIGALLYNPLARVSLSRGIWAAINLATIIALVVFVSRFADPPDTTISDQESA